MATATKIKITEGSEVKISESGYYGFWYPHDDTLILKEDIEVEPISNRKFVEIEGFYACLVEEEVAQMYGSPVNVLWFRKK